MKKYVKKDGKYIIDGVSYKLLSGSRAQVWHGTAYKTTGGLIKEDLVKNKHGEIVSKKKHMQETKDSNLIKHGYGYKTDGTFGYEKIKSTIKKKTKTRQTPIGKSNDIPQQGGYHIPGHETSALARQSSQFGGFHHNKTVGRSRNSYSMGGDPYDGEGEVDEDKEVDADMLYGGKRRKSHRRSHKRRVGVSTSKAHRSKSRSGSRSRMLAGGGFASNANLFL